MEKDVRRAAKGKPASIMRLKEAEAQGKEIPSLEYAMRHIREQERLQLEEQAKKEKGKPKQMKGMKEVLDSRTKRLEKGQMIAENASKRASAQSKAERRQPEAAAAT